MKHQPFVQVKNIHTPKSNKHWARECTDQRMARDHVRRIAYGAESVE